MEEKFQIIRNKTFCSLSLLLAGKINHLQKRNDNISQHPATLFEQPVVNGIKRINK